MRILNDNKFIRTLSELSAIMLKDIVDSTRPRIGHFTRPLTAQEEYLRTCIVSAGEVMTACDQLYFALAYLSGYQSRKTMNDELITRADYIAYQVENLYLRFGMIPDRSLRLTNEVFRLGLPERECKMNTVTDNKRLHGTKVRTRLRAIDKMVGQYREARNKIAHMARYTDSALSQIEPFYILQKLDHPDELLMQSAKRLYKRETDEYIESKRKEFLPIVSDLIDEVGRFFDTLIEPLNREHKALK